MTIFYEGDAVTYTGTQMPPVQGKLVAIASERAAHVQWAEGARAGQIDLVDIYDLAPVTSAAAIARVDPMGHTALRRAMDYEGETGVLNFLVAAKKLTGWNRIAADVKTFVESRLRVDSSMEAAYDQLSEPEMDRVISLAAQTLIRDMAGDS